MRYLPTWSIPLLALISPAWLSLGCSGSGGTTPSLPGDSTALPGTSSSPVASVAASLGSPSQRGDIHESALAIYTIDIDPASLTATVRLKETRSGQANDDLYLLSIDSFLNASSFKVLGVTGTATTLEVDYLVTHPFPAPNNPLGAPNGSTNRADLGIAGMVLLLADVPSASGNTYFTDRVANTSVLENADAYYAPGGLLTVTGTANTFPYRQLVDEAADNRIGMSNGGDVTGNFGSDGWTRSEFGPTNDGWTGYGVLHQGQAARNTFSLRKSALSGGLSLDVAIIAKYPDPRGGATGAQKKANRLPPSLPDASLFAYRMPHGALDAGRIILEPQDGDFMINTISAATVNVHLEDWDARAIETTVGDLSGDTAFDTVSVGESGAPTLEICIPGILGTSSDVLSMGAPVDDDTAYSGDVAMDSGRPFDALFYSQLLTKPAGSGQIAGPVTGMVRATDPEVGLVVGLDETLTPLASAPEPVTYQVVRTALASSNSAPTATVALTSGDPLLSGTMPAISVSGIADFESDAVDILVDWDMGGGFVTVASGLNSPYPAQNPVGPQNNNADLTPDAFNPIVRVQDASGFTDYPLAYMLGPNRAPQVTSSPVLAVPAVPTPATFTLNAGTSTAVDPEGDAVSFTVVNNRNSDQFSFGTFPNAGNTTPVTNPPDSTISFTVYANDPLHATISGTAYPPVVGAIIGPGGAGWVFAPNTQSTSTEQGKGIAVSPMGNVYILSQINSNCDFGGGTLGATIFPSHALVAIDAAGNFLWNRAYISPSGSWVDSLGIGADSAGNVITTGYWRQNMDFGFGNVVNNTSAASSNYDIYVCKYGPTGTPIWQTRSNGDGSSTGILDFQEYNGLAVDPATGDIAIGARFNRTETWGPLTLITNAGPTSTAYDPYVIRISAAGTPLWAQTFTGTSTSQEGVQSVAWTPGGDIIAGGYYRTGMDFGGGARVADASSDGFVVRLNGTTGAYVWDYIFDGTGANQEYVNGVAADGSRAYATGRYYNTTDFGGGARAAGTTSSDPFVVALDLTTGAYNWDRAMAGSTSSEQGRGVAVTAGGVYATGDWYTGTDFGGGVRTTAGGTDAYLLKLNPGTGAILWETRYGSTTTDAGRSVGVTVAGDPIVTGSYFGTVDFDPGPGVTGRTAAGSGADAYVGKYLSATGTIN